MQKLGTTTMVVTVAAVAFVAGRLSGPRSFDEAAFDRGIQAVSSARRLNIKNGLRAIDQEWEAQNSPYRSPVSASVLRLYERPSLEAFIARVTYERRLDCAREAAARR